MCNRLLVTDQAESALLAMLADTKTREEPGARLFLAEDVMAVRLTGHICLEGLLPVRAVMLHLERIGKVERCAWWDGVGWRLITD